MKSYGAVDLAWAAGFLDGEGCFDFSKGHGNFRIQCSQVVKRPLIKLKAVFGGRVYGPYGPYRNNKQRYFQWNICGSVAEAAAKAMLPYYLVKRAQVRAALKKAA